MLISQYIAIGCLPLVKMLGGLTETMNGIVKPYKYRHNRLPAIVYWKSMRTFKKFYLGHKFTCKASMKWGSYVKQLNKKFGWKCDIDL